MSTRSTDHRTWQEREGERELFPHVFNNSLFSFSTSMTCFFHSSKVGMSSLFDTEGSGSLAVLPGPA